MNLVTWLMSLAGPLARQALVSLGFGIVSYVGVSAAVTAALSSAQSAWGGGGAGDVAAFVGLAGVNTALGIIAGGITARVSMLVTKRLIPK